MRYNRTPHKYRTYIAYSEDGKLILFTNQKQKEKFLKERITKKLKQLKEMAENAGNKR